MSRRSSTERSTEEDAALLSGRPTNKQVQRGKWDGWVKLGLGVWAMAATAGRFTEDKEMKRFFSLFFPGG